MSLVLAFENQRRLDALERYFDISSFKQKILTDIYKDDEGVSIAHGLNIEQIIDVDILFRELDSANKVTALHPIWRDGAIYRITETDIELPSGISLNNNHQVLFLLTYSEVAIEPPPLEEPPIETPPTDTTYPDYTELGFSDSFNRLINASPTLVNDINAIKANGWIFKRNYDNDGSFASTSSKEIFVGNKSANYPQNFFNTVAHETAHAMYNEPVDDSSRNAFIDSYLTDEGHSQIYNIKVADEAEANLGITIGWTYLNRFLPAYEQHGFTHKAFYDAGQIVGDEFTTSNTGENYRVYYGNFYDRVYG